MALWFTPGAPLAALAELRLLSLHARAGNLDGWVRQAQGVAALLLLLSAVPRALYGCSREALQGDPAALEVREMLAE